MNKLKPALLGGLIVGLLSSIPIIHYCCCFWGIGGGFLAGFLYIKSAPAPVRAGDGAVIGALAGVIGGLLFFVVGFPVAYFLSGAQMEEALARANVDMPISGLPLFIVAYLVGAIFLLVLSVIGGLISVPIFAKRKDGVPPAPPQQF
jgi:hypothetical protein